MRETIGKTKTAREQELGNSDERSSMTVPQKRRDFADTGDPWIPHLPASWELRRLRSVAEMRVSGIDKKSVEGELPVRLCNYVDVYRHDRITSDLNFMRATAPKEDVGRYRLRVGDVLITKDSESPDDIGIPSEVEYEADDLVSGYHLALLRPDQDTLLGGYLLRVLQAPPLAHQFFVAANGVTRFGLSHGAIKSTRIPLPPLSEQAAIVTFLDHYDARIERLVRSKRRLAALMQEKKTEVSERCVMGGLNPNVAMKPSGVGWIGAIPAHWDVIRGKYLFREVDSRSSTGEETLLSLRMHVGLVPHNSVSKIRIPAANLVGFKCVEPGQIVMNRMRAATGMFAIAGEPGLVSPDYAVFEQLSDFVAEYFVTLFKTNRASAEFRRESKGLGTGQSGFLRLYTDRFGAIKFPVPPRAEQAAILDHLAEATADVDDALKRVSSEIRFLREYRARMISDVAMGQLDVREAAMHLPAMQKLPSDDEISRWEDESEDLDDEVFE